MRTNAQNLLNQTPRNLFLLLLIFIFGIGSQAVLNLSISNFISELDQKIRNAEVENLIGQEIILEIHKIESDFFQMASFPNKHLRKILIADIEEQQAEIEHALDILNRGGVYKHQIDLNLPNTPEQYEIFRYIPSTLDRFAFSKADLLPKFKIIDEKTSNLNQQLDYIDLLKEIGSPELPQALSELELQVKLFKPLFHRIKENANQIFYQNKIEAQKTNQYAEEQKQYYRTLQLSLTLSVFLLGFAAFFTLSRNIRNNTQQIQANQDYTQDILDSQSNIIIINDGKEIIDVSGGFFNFFGEYDTLEAFSKDYKCICDLFIEEEGLIYKFTDKNWIEYLLETPHQNHKVKIQWHGQLYTFQISATQSAKYQRFIISMFDISENERINSALQTEKNNALSAAQTKSSFLANMSHEIRTPLNAILGFIDLLKEKSFDKESQRYLDTIHSSSQSLLGIINDILDLSKIESGKLDIDPVEFDTRKEFESTADLFKAQSSSKNITFNVSIDDNIPRGLKTDILRIKQVISNLVSNAIKFTDARKNIYLNLSYQAGKLCCEVQDEGIGISEDALSRIFEAFVQAESSTTRKYGGTGLGLSISYKLVQMLGGELKVKSELGKGSCFYFCIPAAPIEIEIKKTNQAAMQSALEGHLLLVEDNKTNQMLMSAIIRKTGLSFDIAENGIEAIEHIKNGKYDLVLMDENMPKMNGIEATKQIRIWQKENQKPRTPIIALTANAMTGDRERFILSGMDEYLAKPVNIIKLMEILNLYLVTENTDE